MKLAAGAIIGVTVVSAALASASGALGGAVAAGIWVIVALMSKNT